MSDRNEALAEIHENSWLMETAKDKDISLEAMKGYRLIPRVAIVQAMSKEELKAIGNEGCVINTGNKSVIAGPGVEFKVVPLFFHINWLRLPDLKDLQGSISETKDPNDIIAIKARKKETRIEVYPNNPANKYIYCENFNFICMIYGDHAFAGSMICIPFNRGEHYTGIMWSNKIMTRFIPGMPGQVAKSFSQVYTLRTTNHKNKVGQAWKGFEFVDALPMFIRQEEYEAFKAAHLSIVDAYSASSLGTNYDTQEDVIPPADASERDM